MVKIKRTFTARVRKQCCRNEDVVYNPQDRDFKITDTKEKNQFEYSLVIWKDNVEKQIEKLADNECRKKGTPRLCNFLVYNTKVTEELIPEKVPQYLLDQIELLQERIKESKDENEKQNLQNTLDKLKEYIKENYGQVI